MAVTRRPTVQAYPTKYVQKPSAYWQSRGLVLSFLGNRLVYSRDTPIIPALTTTGTPKNQAGPHSDAVGFGTTYGTGTTDMLTGGVLPVTATKARSVFTSLYLNNYGGGGFGRVFQNATGTGLNGGESLYPSATTITYNNFIVSSASVASWIFPVAPATARWTSIGISIADISGATNTGSCYLDGALASTYLQAGIAGGLGSNVATSLTWGNRTTSGDRGLDGMLSITHFFDTELSAKDQRMLDANPNCVWAVPNVRRTAAAGGLTLNPTLFSNTNTFFAPTVTPGTTSLTPGLFTNTNQFYAAVVSLGGSQTLVPGLLSNANDFFAPTVTPGAVTLTPSLFSNSNSFYAPTITPGEVTLLPDRLDNTNVFFSPTVTLDTDQVLHVGFLADTNTFFAPVVSLASGPQTLAPELFSNTSSFFSPTVAPGTVTLTPSLFTNDNTFFDCVVLRDGDQILSPSLFTNDNAFFSLVVNGGQTTYAGEIDLTPRKWYIRRNKKILLFNTAQEADAFLEAEELAEQAVHAAQKTSRRARKRLRDKIITVEPIQTVDVDQLAQAVEHFSIPVDLPYLLAQQDFERVMQILALAADMQDEEDVELLLLA